MTRKSHIDRRIPAGPNHQVVSVVSTPKTKDDTYPYRRSPCATCPWRVDAVGEFPPQAFLISAHIAYDQAMETFGCHESGVKHATTCAGFILRSEHNLALRILLARDKVNLDQIDDGGHELHADYRAMAIANGVDPDDTVLLPCR